jgi:protein-arginine kinase activator protein McsA
MTNTTSPESRINARLDADITRKLHELMRLERKSVTEVIKASIAHYHAVTCQRSAAPHKALVQSGFIGCAEASSDLSTTYKRSLGKTLARKHGYR